MARCLSETPATWSLGWEGASQVSAGAVVWILKTEQNYRVKEMKEKIMRRWVNRNKKKGYKKKEKVRWRWGGKEIIL